MGIMEVAIAEGFGHRDGGRAAPPLRGDRRASEAPAGLWARHLWAWLTGTGYRPEGPYMHGGRGRAGLAPRPRPA